MGEILTAKIGHLNQKFIELKDYTSSETPHKLTQMENSQNCFLVLGKLLKDYNYN